MRENQSPSLQIALNPNSALEYVLPVKIRQTTTATSGTTVYAFRNSVSSTKTVYLKAINLALDFDGATSLTTKYYDLCRFSGATPSGGTSLTVIKAQTSDDTSNVTDARYLDTGLTTTNVTFESAFHTIGISINKPNGSQPIVFNNGQIPNISLAPGEGFAIRTNGTTSIGLGLFGSIAWVEK